MLKILGMSARIMIVVATAAHSADLPSGDYEGRGDGSIVSMRVAGAQISISTVAVGSCSGAADGVYRQLSDGTWLAAFSDGNGYCEARISKKTGDTFSLQPDDCGYFHGHSCGFYSDSLQLQN